MRSAEAPFGFIVQGLFCLGMGKLGAHELNYSSDIDISIFFDPQMLSLAPGVEPQTFATRFTDRVAAILQARTAEGYVFRVDLRLRPDPSSTPNAVSLPSAFFYYESVGQNWERAAFIKARAIAGDLALGESFLHELRPFIWRRNLDFAAIADIHSIKRQIHAHKVDERLTAAGADLKLGRGGIREIEFFVQTQQLILGGRQPSLRHRETLATLHALSDHGHVTRDDATTLEAAYRELRALEHRAQMIADEQTHRLPENADQRKAIAALAGFSRLPSFDAAVSRTLRTVNAIYARLFAGEEELSSEQGSLVFTGVEDDPETLATLGRLGFKEAAKVSAMVRSWHHGRIGATRTERGRELFTRLAPRLLDACSATGAPDIALARFADGQDLVEQEDLGLEVGSHREGQPHVHAARVALDRGVEELLQAGELDDGVELPVDLGLVHAEDRPVQVHVLATGQLGVEPGAHLEQAADTAPQPDLAGRRRRDPGEQLQQGALARPVAPDEPQHLALVHVEAHVLEGPELLLLRPPQRVPHPVEGHLGQGHMIGLVVTDGVRLAEAPNRQRQFAR